MIMSHFLSIKDIIMETQIKFTQWQIENILFRDMVKSKEVSNVAHIINIQPQYENSKIIGINVIAKEKNNLKKQTKILFTIEQIEYLAFQEMIATKKIQNIKHSIKVDLNIDKKDNKLIISALNVTATEIKKSLISKKF